MIVKDKSLTIQKANDISRDIISIISTEAKDFGCEDDPAEHIYLLCHIMGNLTANILMILQGFSDTYGIPSVNIVSFHEWINIITKEHLTNNVKEV